MTAASKLKPLPEPVCNAYQRILANGRQTTKGTHELFGIASRLTGAKFDWARWHIFETTNWGDGGSPTVSTPALLMSRDWASLMLVAYRAERQLAEASPHVKHRVTYQLVLQVDHPLHPSAVAWIDAETGAVRESVPWQKAEEDSKKVLTAEQLNGTACVVCGGVGGSVGMYPLGLETTTSAEVFRCYNCPQPSKAMVQRWICNSGGAVESEVAK